MRLVSSCRRSRSSYGSGQKKCRKRRRCTLVESCSTDSLPDDGSPAKFEVVQEKVVDAWTTYKDVPVGAVYLSRSGNEVTAFNLKCPHLGCAIDFRKQSNDYFCPCHNSSFALDGSVTTENSPSPRPMDTMETKVEKGQVWIRFQHFRPNIPEKKPLA